MTLLDASRLIRRITSALALVPAVLGAQQVVSRTVPPANPVVDDAPATGGRATATAATAYRARQAPVLDGRDDDPAWRDAQVIDQFLEYDPNPGAETRFKTQARVL